MLSTIMSLRFQSAPLTKARGDQKVREHSRTAHSFNPLPSQKQGETRMLNECFEAEIVSIRSPHKSKGRQDTAISSLKVVMFQSAPLTKARGDLH